MGLPKLDTPTYRLELPSTGEEIQYRPFLVKEQKLLMIAQESEDEKEILDSVSKVIRACTFDKIDVSTSPLFDVEYVFLKIRSRAVGENAELQVLCPDDEETRVPVNVNLNDIEVQMGNNHTNQIDITGDIKLMMKYPCMTDMKGMKLGDSLTTVDTVFAILKNCIHKIHNGDTIYRKVDLQNNDLEEFIDSFSTQQLESVMEFFNTMPKLRHTVEVTNPKTDVKSQVMIEGLESFLV
jgi:hypothetical protein